ncbi:MAG: ATP-grasp domain-containing protein [Pseudomonadota bacterium]
MKKNVLITLGRLPKGLDLVRALSRAGCRIIIAEPFGWHPCRVSRHVAQCYRVTAPNRDREKYVDELARIIAREHIDLVVPVSEEIMHVAALRGRVTDTVRLFMADQATLLALHNKETFIAKANALGLAVPETHRLGTAEAQALAGKCDTIVKFVYSCAGMGLKRIQRGEQLPAAKHDRPALVQASINGREVSTFSIVEQGRLIVTAMYQGTVRSGTTAVAMRRIADAPLIQKWVKQFTKAIDFSGFISFDFIIDDAGIAHAIECNPRVSSGIHFLESPSLAMAILDPVRAQNVEFRKNQQLQQFFTCLTETQGSIFRWSEFRANLHYLTRSRDVMWRWDDPLPLLLMTPTSFEILRRVIVEGMSFGEAAIVDIDWLGDQSSD